MRSGSPWRPTFWRGVFWLLLALGLVLTVVRFSQGLSSVTNLSDRSPWGLWVGFDLLCGVGLAAGGFVVTGIVYVFHLERFRPIVRPTILTAFLGYLMVVVGLLYDIGRPWNVWHPLIMWNPSSVMFEVAWCVMLYSTVLALEASGMVFERLNWRRAARIQHAVSVPLVVLGVVLSTLHQSSLGTLFLIVPGKLHPLWYTPMLPILFWVSSVAIGFGMVIAESRLSSRAFHRQLEMPLLSDVGRILVGILAVYGVLRVFDLAARGVLPQAFSLTYEAGMFWVEIALGLAIPIALLAFPSVRQNARWLYAAALSACLGFVVHRLNVSVTGFDAANGGRYVPAVSEALISLFVVAMGFAAFSIAVRTLPVFPAERAEKARAVEEEEREPAAVPARLRPSSFASAEEDGEDRSPP